MKRLTLIFTMAGVVVAAAQAPAGDWKGQPLAVKRQLVAQFIDCMKKRMSTDRLVSYNQASKECREQVGRRTDKAAAVPLVAADTRAK
jgi:hypothetical protein